MTKLCRVRDVAVAVDFDRAGGECIYSHSLNNLENFIFSMSEHFLWQKFNFSYIFIIQFEVSVSAASAGWGEWKAVREEQT